MLDKELIEFLTMVAYQQGPFFFSILFMLVIVGMAHRCYRKVNLRTNPEASSDEKKCYKMYFLSSIVASLMLVFVSVSWWMYANATKHTIRGTIVGLNSTSKILSESDNMYLRKTEKTLTETVRLADYHFAIVRDAPFSPGQKFPILFFPENGYLGERKPTAIQLYVQYSGKDEANYRIIKDGELFSLANSH